MKGGLASKKGKTTTAVTKKDPKTRNDLIEKSEAYKARMEKIQASRLTKESKQASKTSITSILFETSSEYNKDLMEQLNSWWHKSKRLLL